MLPTLERLIAARRSRSMALLPITEMISRQLRIAGSSRIDGLRAAPHAVDRVSWARPWPPAPTGCWRSRPTRSCPARWAGRRARLRLGRRRRDRDVSGVGERAASSMRSGMDGATAGGGHSALGGAGGHARRLPGGGARDRVARVAAAPWQAAGRRAGLADPRRARRWCRRLHSTRCSRRASPSILAAALLGLPIFATLGGIALLLFWNAGRAGGGGSGRDVPPGGFARSCLRFRCSRSPGICWWRAARNQRLLRVYQALFGWLPGGLAITTAVVCAIFTWAGSGVTILAMGGLLLPMLMKARYPENFSIGLINASGSLGLLFPPSLPVILYGIYAHTPIDQLFIGGFLPGLLMVAMVSAWGVFQGSPDTARNAPRSPAPKRCARCGRQSGNWPCPSSCWSDSSAVSALWWKPAPSRSLTRWWSSAWCTTALSLRRDFGGVADGVRHGHRRRAADRRCCRGIHELPGGRAGSRRCSSHGLRTHIHSKYVFLLLLNLVLLLKGSFMDVFSAIIVVVPLITPIAARFGIDPVQLGDHLSGEPGTGLSDAAGRHEPLLLGVPVRAADGERLPRHAAVLPDSVGGRPADHLRAVDHDSPSSMVRRAIAMRSQMRYPTCASCGHAAAGKPRNPARRRLRPAGFHEFGDRPVHIFHPNLQRPALLHQLLGNLEPHGQHRVVGLARVDARVREQRVVVLLPQRGIVLKQQLGVHFRHILALLFRPARVDQGKRVAHDPADIRGSPVDVAGVNSIDILHGSLQGHEVAAVVANHAFRLPGRAGRIQDVQRIACSYRDALVWGCRFQDFIPVAVAPRHEFGTLHLALENDTSLGFVSGDAKRFVEEGFIWNDSLEFHSTRGGNDHFRLGVVDTRSQFVRGKASENHGVDRPQAGTGKHGHDRLGDHRHVHDDAIALADAQVRERSGEAGYLIAQFAIGKRFRGIGNGTIVNQCGLLATAFFNVEVEGVIAGVHFAAGEPAIERLAAVIEHLLPALVPVDRFRCIAPKTDRIL